MRNEKDQFKTVRSMLTWSHYSFQQWLKHKAEEIGMKIIMQMNHILQKHVLHVGEKFTSARDAMWLLTGM